MTGYIPQSPGDPVKELKVRRHWWMLLLMALFALTGIMGIVSMVWFSLDPPSGESESWWLTALASLFTIVLVIVPCRNPVVSFFTRFTDAGIVRPSIRGKKFIPWTDIQRVDFRYQEIRLRTLRGDIRIHHRLYDNPEQVLSEIVQRVKDAQNGS